MPTERTWQLIQESARDENTEDFAALVDSLTSLRCRFDEGRNPEEDERIAGFLICLLVKPKPDSYQESLYRFRGLFTGISEQRQLRSVFVNCINNAALTVDELDEVVFVPSLYFDPVPVLRLRVSMEDSETAWRIRERWLFDWWDWI